MNTVSMDSAALRAVAETIHSRMHSEGGYLDRLKEIRRKLAAGGDLPIGGSGHNYHGRDLGEGLVRHAKARDEWALGMTRGFTALATALAFAAEDFAAQDSITAEDVATAFGEKQSHAFGSDHYVV